MIAHASAPAPLGCKAPVGRDETLDHRHRDLLGRQGFGETGRLCMHLGIGHQLAIKGIKQLDRELHGLVICDRTEPELTHPDYCPVANTLEPLRTGQNRSEEHTSELQSLLRISYAVFCLKKKKKLNHDN